MRKTYDLKQVKISTSILWLLNKAQARKVFFSSTDIFSDKSNLLLHSLIIRGLVSGELYSAALSNLFSSAHNIIHTKDFPSILSFIFELDTMHLEEVDILRQKDEEVHIESLMRQQPFEISEHLQIIDAIMAVNIIQSDVVLSIPTILGKLCNFRPTIIEPKKLLEVWFKSISCLCLTERNIKNMLDLMKLIIMETKGENEDEYKYLENIKFSDKMALIISYDNEFIGVEENFLFQYSSDGSTDRNNIKHNFMTILNIFRKKFPKILEDFKEMMLVLNSSHVQISSNMLINIDTFMLEFFISIDEYNNHGNRTFRRGPNNPIVAMSNKMEKTVSSKDKIGSYHSQTINKPPSYFKEQFSKANVFGTYSGRRAPPVGLEDPSTKDNSVKWDSQTVGSNLLNDSKKKSLPGGLDGLYNNRMASSEVLLTDGSLKSMYVMKKNQKQEVDINKTSWLEQLERGRRTSNESSQSVVNDQENGGPKIKVNETRLRLNLKRKEIERNRFKIQQTSAKEIQLLSDQAFKDVAIKGARNNEDEYLGHRAKRVSDMKRNKAHPNKKDLIRSRSQDVSKTNVEDISASLDQLKSQISKLTSQQEKLSARLEDKRSEDVEMFSPRTEYSGIFNDREFGSRSNIRSSTRSNPSFRSIKSPYSNEQYIADYQAEHPRLQYPVSYQYVPQYPQYFPYPTENIPYYHSQPPQERFGYFQPPTNRTMAKSVQESINSRITSPGAVSEPRPPFDDDMPPKNEQNKDDPKLTVNNLIKHNESMEVLGPSHLSQEWIKNVSKEDVNAIDVRIETEKVPDEGIPHEATKGDDETSKEVVQAFYVSFNEDESKDQRKSPRKPPKPSMNKKNLNKENISLATSSVKSEEVIDIKPVMKEKPVAFVIPVDTEEGLLQTTNNELVVKEKLSHLSEKREQERKEKLEKIRESSKHEIEKRMEREMEKEKLKQEKEMKRKAIFEAYLEKKLEKECNDKPKRRDSRIHKRLNRAVSAAPLQRNDLENNYNIDYTSILTSLSPPEMQSSITKTDKASVPPSSTKLFVAPKIKSNKGVIINAIKYCCLAGKVNEDLKHQTIEDLEKSDSSHCMVLMRSGCQYRSIYSFNPETEVLVKISGMGPKKVTSKMVERFYKYNSGSKKFTEIDSTSHLSTVIDGITIYNTLWKSTVPSSGHLLSSETSSQAEQFSQ